MIYVRFWVSFILIWNINALGYSALCENWLGRARTWRAKKVTSYNLFKTLYNFIVEKYKICVFLYTSFLLLTNK